jgi:hypothetical protein
MNGFSNPPTMRRNPLTYKRHQREMLRQVTIPLAIGCLIILAFAILVVRAGLGGGDTGRWASISMIWLIAPVMLLSVISLAFLVGSIYATIRLIQALPKYSYLALGWMLLLGLNLRRLNDRLVEPLLKLHSFSASLKTVGKRVSKK